MSSTVSQKNKRQSAKTDKSTAARMARERRTAENKARKLLAQLRRSGGQDSTAARALVYLTMQFPHLRNLKV